MQRSFGGWALSIMCVLGTAACLAADESPLRKAAVGDFVEFKAAAPSLGFGPKTEVTLYLRYTVKAKNDKTATLTMKSWAGPRETAERDIEVPLDQSLDGSVLTPVSDDKAKVTLAKTVPDATCKIRNKEFKGTIYQYKVAIDLFSGLGLKGGDDAKKPEMTFSYFVSPEAPVLGIVAISMESIMNVRYTLSDGTGVQPLLYPLQPTSSELAQVGDWVEYRGTNGAEGKQVVLRHTVTAKEGSGATVKVELSVGGETKEPWEIAIPNDNPLAGIALWPALESGAKPKSDSSSGRVEFGKIKVLDNFILECRERRRRIVLKEGDEPVLVRVHYSKSLPLTGLAKVEFGHGSAVEAELTLASHSGAVDESNLTKVKPRQEKMEPAETSEAAVPTEEAAPVKKPSAKPATKSTPKSRAKAAAKAKAKAKSK